MKQASQEENRKQEVQLWEFAVDQLHIISDWTTSISICVSTRLGELGAFDTFSLPCEVIFFSQR